MPRRNRPRVKKPSIGPRSRSVIIDSAFRQLSQIGRISQLASQAGVRPGSGNESRAIEVLQAYLAGMPSRPPWLKSIRSSTPAEDQYGIDLVIETDGQPVCLQVKSSDPMATGFKQRQRRRWHQGDRVLIIGMVVVDHRLTDRQLGRQIMSEIVAVRNMIQNLGSSYLPATQITEETLTEATNG